MIEDDYHKRKEERRLKFTKNHGKKMVECTACDGSGYYDSAFSPKCSVCHGT